MSSKQKQLLKLDDTHQSESPIPIKSWNFFEQIEIDYGITKIGENEFQVNIDGAIITGTLSSIMSIAKGEGEGIWGNP